MYIRRKVYSVYTDEETGEERLFCEDQIMSEEEYLERLYAESQEEDEDNKPKKSTVRQVGKAAAIAGGAGTLGLPIAQEIYVNKLNNDIAKRHGVEKSGFGSFSKLKNWEKLPRDKFKAVNDDIIKTAAEKGKYIKRFGYGTLGAAGVAAAGTGAYLYGRHKDKKRNKS